MSDISVLHLDSVYVKLDCERSVAKELSDFFTFKVPNHEFSPAYKKKIWDGTIKLFSLYKQTIYRGLLDYVIQFAKDRNYTIQLEETLKDSLPSSEFSQSDVTDFIESLSIVVNNKAIKPHLHQVNAIQHALNTKRCLLLSPTASGKSLIIYTLMRYYMELLPPDKKLLIIVPTTGLVSQMLEDFKDYSSNDDWDCMSNCHQVFSGQSKETDKRIIISTWQSLYNMPKEYFSKFGCVFGDECHLFKAKSLSTLMSNLDDCYYRIGTTGTLDGTQTHKLVIEGLFGRVFQVTTTKNLMDKKLLSTLDINCLVLQYTKDEKEFMKRKRYQDEIEWIVTHEKRNKFIAELTNRLKGNTLVLFNYVEKHGKPLYELISQGDKETFLIHGATDVIQREEIRKIVDKKTNSVLVASYGTCSTGINIRNIDNIIFSSPSKSVVRVLQSIGRGLRKSDRKNKVKLFDLSDDLSIGKYENHTFRHLGERIKIYTNEQFDYELSKIHLRR